MGKADNESLLGVGFDIRSLTVLYTVKNGQLIRYNADPSRLPVMPKPKSTSVLLGCSNVGTPYVHIALHTAADNN
jgi:hypothetical protein